MGRERETGGETVTERRDREKGGDRDIGKGGGGE